MMIKQRIPDWLIGLVLTLFFLFVTFTGILDFTDPIEMKTFDFRADIAAPPDRNPDIELVVITDDDLSELGRFPWPRHILAQGVQNLALAGAKVIALNILLAEPEETAGLKAMRQLRETYQSSGLAQEGTGQAFLKKVSEAIADLDNDTKLRMAFEKAGNVVLPVYFDTLSTGRDVQVPDFVREYAFKQIKGTEEDWAVGSLIWVSRLKPLLPAFAEVAQGIGHINLFPDGDGSVRNQVHVLGYLKDTYFPSLPIAIVKIFKGLKDEDITVVLGKEIQFKVSPSAIHRVPVVDPRMRTLINWSQGPALAFHQTPFSKVYRNEVQTSLFRDKIVIIGPTAPGLGDRFVTPISGNLPGIEVVANSVANILNQKFFSRPSWVLLVETGVLIVFGLFITSLLPRLRAGVGAVTTLALLVGYTAVGTGLFFHSHVWLKITPPTILLILGYLLVTSKRFLVTEKTKERVEADSFETNKMLGISFQQQGMLDLALEKFRRLPPEEEGVKDLLYNLGLDYERKRQFSKALAAYRLIVEDGKDFGDLAERIPKLKHAEATMIFGSPGTKHPGDIGATLMETDTKPTLGRYEVIGELGRGAMGVVYRGEDPKIHRAVAIKTLRLTDFEDNMASDIKDRFFREAESAGLLNHPNIVTIYDCGEEHDLAYIAMEYLEGETLEKYTKEGDLLPLREAISLIADVADALDYAHSKGVVHRDIKPANIIRLRETGDVKVTDFGIARITTSSRTKTGVVLGTPSYMSPEQVSGKKVDGRSDIFSLGVVLYEMLTGQKPFVAEDITSLMFKISKEEPLSPRSLNSKIPLVVEKIVKKAIEKDLDKRYQRARQVAAHLRQVAAKIDEIQARRQAEAARPARA